MVSECVIARPINGISLNGLEYVLDEFGEVKRFETRCDAVDFLKGHGYILDEEIREMIHEI